MILNYEQIKSITKGALQIEETPEGKFKFYRFDAHGRNYYENIATVDMTLKSLSPAGIFLEFVTDSDVFEFTYDVKKASSRVYYYFDVYVDDILRTHKGEQDMWICHGNIKLDLTQFSHKLCSGKESGSEHKVTLWLPALSHCQLSNVTLSDGATVKPVPYTRKMLCFGDSITQGYDAYFPSKTYVARLAKHFDAFTVNNAIGGEKFVPALLNENPEFIPDIITVAYGTNDWSGKPRAEFEKLCTEFFEKAAKIYPNAEKFAILPIWRADGKRIPVKFEGTFDEACDFIEARAIENGFHVIDGRYLIPRDPAFYWDSRLHPNDMGFGEYAAGLITEIEKYVK